MLILFRVPDFLDPQRYHTCQPSCGPNYDPHALLSHLRARRPKVEMVNMGTTYLEWRLGDIFLFCASLQLLSHQGNLVTPVKNAALPHPKDICTCPRVCRSVHHNRRFDVGSTMAYGPVPEAFRETKGCNSGHFWTRIHVSVMRSLIKYPAC